VQPINSHLRSALSLRVKGTLVCIATLSALASAATATATDVTTERLRSTLQERFKDTKVEHVGASLLPGLYEVVIDGQIVYADASGDHLVMGPLVDTTTRRNLTDERLSEINAIDFGELPLNLAIKTVKGTGQRQLAVFADPHCPYCMELEKAFEQVADVTIYTFLYPLEGLHPGATARAHDLWCKEDRASAWKEWMLTQQAQPATECADDPLAELQARGAALRINTTPTLFLQDGRRIVGAQSPQRLEALLNEAPIMNK
jgi:thiol:disulfide interchange protein DsbC